MRGIYGRLWRRGLLVAVLAGPAASGPVAAMTFTVETVEPGRRAVIARGAIEAGDVARLQKALQAADRNAQGFKLLVLDSPGGPIVEAFAIAEAMDTEQVETRVRAGASCASSCAMIVFVAGTLRTVEAGGRLGVHTCHDGATGSRSMFCNEMIAQHALKRGVPYLSSMALLHLTAAGEVRWLDAGGAACWQLTRSETPASPAPPADPAACPPPLAERVSRGR